MKGGTGARLEIYECEQGVLYVWDITGRACAGRMELLRSVFIYTRRRTQEAWDAGSWPHWGRRCCHLWQNEFHTVGCVFNPYSTVFTSIVQSTFNSDQWHHYQRQKTTMRAAAIWWNDWLTLTTIKSDWLIFIQAIVVETEFVVDS